MQNTDQQFTVKQCHPDRPYTLVGRFSDAAAAVSAARASAVANGLGCIIEAGDDEVTVYSDGFHKGAYHPSALQTALIGGAA